MALLEEIVPFVYAIPGGYVNSFLIAEKDGITLVDSGLKGNERKIGRAIRELGRKPEEIRTVLITHHHADHVGSLAALLASSGAAAWAHPLDAPIIAGDKPRPQASKSSILGLVLGPIVYRLPQNNPPPARTSHDAIDGAVVPVAGGVQVFHTPGHTMGHVSYFMPGHGGFLFAGDAAGHMFGKLAKPLGMFTEDMGAAKESIRKLAALEFDTACFGHGGVLKGKASLEFKRYVDRRARAAD